MAQDNTQREQPNEGRASSNEGRANENRGSSNGGRPSPNEGRASSSEIRASSNESRPSSDEAKIPSHEGNAASYPIQPSVAAGKVPADQGKASATEGRTESKIFGKDITGILSGWDYEAGTINVRKISGADGIPKLQMRLDLGLLQMELTGRPDGFRPRGYESLLEFHEEALRDHKLQNGTELGFHLTADQCQELREEAVMYYHRYLSLFVLEDFPGVVRDTARNLRVLDICGKYAIDDQDRLMLEQYRPYITMMNTRAAASLLFKEQQYAEALATVKAGLASIKRFFVRFGHPSAYNQSGEVRVLKSFGRDIRRKLPIDPKVKLQNRLQKAVLREDYEEAARLRDELKAIENA